MSKKFEPHHPDVDDALRNVFACAYNAAVNYGSERQGKKMRGLIEALNVLLRVEGRVKLERLVEAGVIESFDPCPDECEMRPGGLFHAKGCTNEMNHDVYRARTKRAREMLSGGDPDGTVHDGYWDADVSLVGKPGFDSRSYYHTANVTAIVRGLTSDK